MFRLLAVCGLAVLSAAAPPPFRGDPSTAAILADSRRLGADGSSDVAYAQEDGVLFKETTSGDGERRGSYEFVGDDGKLFRVEYTAGAGGFQVISSTHVDSTPQHLPTGPDDGQYREQTEQYREQPAARPATRKNVHSFSVGYDSSQPAATPASYATAAPPPPPPPRTTTTTTTTTPRPVRRNHHNGQVSLERHSQGYVYSYTKSG